MISTLSLSEKHIESLESRKQRFESWLTMKQLGLIKLHQDKESFINQLWIRCVALFNLIPNLPQLLLNKTFYTLGFLPRNNWKTFKDKLASSKDLDLNMFTTELYQTLAQELTFKEKVSSPFWTPAYKKLSEKLLLPTQTVSVVSVTNSSNNSLKEAVVKSPFWIKNFLFELYNRRNM